MYMYRFCSGNNDKLHRKIACSYNTKILLDDCVVAYYGHNEGVVSHNILYIIPVYMVALLCELLSSPGMYVGILHMILNLEAYVIARIKFVDLRGKLWVSVCIKYKQHKIIFVHIFQ